MESESICEILKEILPELQARIKKEFQAQYQQKIQSMQQQYQAQIERILHQKDESARLQTQEEGLYKRVAMLENQRKNWCKMEIQYQNTIRQMAERISKYEGKIVPKQVPLMPKNKNLRERNDTEFSEMSSIHPPPSSIQSSEILVTKKYDLPRKSSELNKLHLKKSAAFSSDEESKSSTDSLQQVLMKNLDLQNEDKRPELRKEEKALVQDKKEIQHYKSVLSPPRAEIDEPACEPSTSIFWNEDKKKHLLSLIKLK